MRFVGQRVAAVVADRYDIAENACRALIVDYEELPAVFDPDAASSADAPLLHADKDSGARIADPNRNLVAELHGEVGDVAAGIAAAEASGGAVVRGRWQTQRVQHVHLETHGCTGWRDDSGRLVIRTSTQVPFLVRNELCHIFGLRADDVHVFTKRVGGGFGGKQEMLTEDLVALAVLRLGTPVRYEFHRSDQFTVAPCRHPFRVDVTVAADGDGVLSALAIDVLVDAGAYGNHSPGVMFHGCGNPLRCTAARTSASTPAPFTPTTCPRARSAGTGSARSCSPSSPRWTNSPTGSTSIPSSSGAATSSCPVTASWTPMCSTTI